MRLRAILLASAVAIGCGREGPQVRAVAAPTEQAVAASPPPRPPPLQPVRPPADLVVVGRLKNLARVADMLAQRGVVPADWRAELAALLPGVQEDLGLPIELAATLTDHDAGLEGVETQFVLSLGLPSTDSGVAAAKALGLSVEPAGPAAWRFQWTDDKTLCEVAPALGPAPARVVCGEPPDLDALLGYATRGLPREPLTDADVRVEVRMAALRHLISEQTTALYDFGTSLDQDDRTAGVLREAISTFESLHHVAIEGRLTPDGLETSLSATFQDSTPWLVDACAEMSRSISGIPAAYWRLPQDAVQATYSGELGNARLERVRSALSDIAVDLLKERNASPRLTRDIRRAIAWTLSGLPAMVTARGFVPPDPKPISTRVERMRQRFGWAIWGTESIADDYKAYFDAMTRLANDPEVVKLAGVRGDVEHCLRDGSGDLSACLRGLAGKKQGGGAAMRPAGAQLVRRSPEGLAPGAAAYRFDIPEAWLMALDDDSHANEPAHGKGMSLVLMVVPEDSLTTNRTWIGLSADENILRHELQRVLESRDTLAQRPELNALRSGRLPKSTLVGGFTTWEAFAHGSDLLPSLGPADAMLLPFDIDLQGWPGAPTLRFDISVPNAILRDVVMSAIGAARSDADGGP
jgi:hypothetical protein